MNDDILLGIEDGVGTVTLNRPDRLNAVTDRMGVELRDAFDRSDGDDNVRAVIVTGNGRAFSAGADLDSFTRQPEGLSTREVAEVGRAMADGLEAMRAT